MRTEETDEYLKLGWRTLTLRDLEVKNWFRLTREMIEDLHNLIEADISAQTDRSNPVPTMTKVLYCFNYVLI